MNNTNTAPSTRWVRANVAKAIVFERPTASAERAGSVFSCEQLTYLGIKQGNFALCEFNYSDGSVRRGYIDAYTLTDNMAEVMQRSPGVAFTATDRLPAHLPCGGGYVTQGFNDLKTKLRGHFGYDLGVPGGNIRPLLQGTFVSSVPNVGLANGRTVTIKHTLCGEVFYTTYSHLASVCSFSAGQTVYPTTLLGKMGGSGTVENAFAPHLHLSCYVGQPQNNPMGYCDKDRKKTFAQAIAKGGATHGWYYGADPTLYPRCGGVRFYDPYRVYTSAGEVIKQTRNDK